MKIITDWNRVNFESPADQRKVLAAIQHYLSAPARAREAARAKAQEFTVNSNFPALPIGPDVVFRHSDPWDAGWMFAFDIADYTQTKKDSMTVDDVDSALTFEEVKPGEKAKVYKLVGERATVYFSLFGGALGLSKVWMEDNEWYRVEDVITTFRDRWYHDQSLRFYQLLSAARADSDVAWQGSAGQATASRDAETINYAIAAIIADCDSLGMNVSAQSEFVVFAPIQLAHRLQAALANGYAETVMGGAPATTAPATGGKVAYNVRPVYTTMLYNNALSALDTTHFLVALPGRKSRAGFRMPLTLVSETDILAYAENMAGFGRDTGVIGQTSQLRRLTLA